MTTVKKKIVTGVNVPKSHLPFSPAIQSGNYVFISGQASTDSEGKIVTGTFEEECRRSFENIKKILDQAGVGFQDVVQVRNYIGRQEYLSEFNNIYKEYFSAPYPVRTTIMGCLGNLLKFEADVVAYKKQE